MQIVNVATFELRSINKYQHYAIRCDTFYKVVEFYICMCKWSYILKKLSLNFFFCFERVSFLKTLENITC